MAHTAANFWRDLSIKKSNSTPFVGDLQKWCKLILTCFQENQILLNQFFTTIFQNTKTVCCKSLMQKLTKSDLLNSLLMSVKYSGNYSV